MSLSAAIALLAAVIVLIGLMQVSRKAGRNKLRWWRELAKREKLRMDEGREPHDAALKGVFRGVRVSVTVGGGRIPPPLSLFTRVTAELPGAGPPGLLLTSHSKLVEKMRGKLAPQLEVDDPELGGAYSVYGHDNDKTIEVVLDPAVRETLLELRKRAALVHITELGVHVEVQGIVGPELPALVELTARTAAGISEAYERTWSDFAKEHGLVFLGAGTRGERTLRGYIGGTRVTIQTGPMPENPEIQFSTIKVGLGVRLPAGMRLLPKAFTPETRGEFPLGHAALDELVRVQGTNREAIRALLLHPQVRDHLVAFFDVCPYTMLEGGQVVAGGPGLLSGDVIGQVAAVDDLAETFRTGWNAVQSKLSGGASA